MTTPATTPSTTPGFVRIIGGKWRGRKISVPSIAAVRPTPDRVRETVFNWLLPHLPDARCLDAFAGPGVLGLEALSRGAQCVTFIESDRTVYAHLTKTISTLQTDQTELMCGKFPENVTSTKPFNIIFLDPPFRQGLINTALNALIKQKLLAENALLYVETEKELALSLPESFHLLKQKVAGEVAYYLLSYRQA